MKQSILYVLLGLWSLAAHDVLGATYYTRSSGSWKGNIWGPTTSGTGLPLVLADLQDGDTLHIDDNITLSGEVRIEVNVFIKVSATITFAKSQPGKLYLTGQSIFQLMPGGQLLSEGNGNAQVIEIGNNEVYTGHDPDRTGPGFFDDGGWNPGVLPVKMLYLKADAAGDNIVLSWATSTEENFRHFIIERSNNGANFESVGMVAGKGFDIYDIESKYNFVDVTPYQGFNYYRLKAVDLDDTFEYFGVVVAKIDAPKKLSVYPNPTSGASIDFDLNFSPGEHDRVVLTDQMGVEVFEGMVNVVQNRVVFPDKLNPGVYLLRYLGAGFEQTTRVLVRN